MKLKLSLLVFVILQIMIVKKTIAQSENDLTVNINGIKEIKGNLYVYLYSQSEGFPTKPEMAKKFVEVIVTAEKIHVKFENIQSGTYAVSVFHDVNSNREMDTNFLGIPKEPIGVSNNAKGSYGPPKFNDAKFSINANKTITLKIE